MRMKPKDMAYVAAATGALAVAGWLFGTDSGNQTLESLVSQVSGPTEPPLPNNILSAAQEVANSSTSFVEGNVLPENPTSLQELSFWKVEAQDMVRDIDRLVAEINSADLSELSEGDRYELEKCKHDLLVFRDELAESLAEIDQNIEWAGHGHEVPRETVDRLEKEVSQSSARYARAAGAGKIADHILRLS